MVGELARISGDCGLRPPAELTMLGKALLNLDQVADKLDPDFDPNPVRCSTALRRRTCSPRRMDAKELPRSFPAGSTR